MTRATERLIQVAAIVVATLLIGGCAAGATPEPDRTAGASLAASPAASAPASPSPSPTPEPSMGPAEAFEALAASDDWAFTADVAGMIFRGAEGNDIYYATLYGRFSTVGSDGGLLIAVADDQGLQASDSTHVDERLWVREAGVLREVPHDASARDLVSALIDVGPVEGTGTETVDGRELTILTAIEPVDLGSLGGVRLKDQPVEADLEFLVDDDGWPVVIRVRSGEAPAEHPDQLELIGLEPVDAGASIDRPSDWTPYESDHGYRLRLPPNCGKVETTVEKPVAAASVHCGHFSVGVTSFLGIGNVPLEEWGQGSFGSIADAVGAEPATHWTARLADGADGEPAWVAVYRFDREELGVPVAMALTSFVHEGTGFNVSLTGLDEDEVMNVATFMNILSTLEFTG